MKKLESVGVLAGGIAHDFNNILAAILGNINLALLDEDLGDQSRILLTEAEKASLRARDLTQQLLTFSRGGDPIKETASLANVIEESASFVLRGDKVACHFNIPDDLWLVNMDKGQMGQVIQNIVINASQAMKEGGIIHITCENQPFVATHILPHGNDGKYVKISIQDSGVGIPHDLIEKIFDPYFSTKNEGNGLGLAICQSIVNKHDGVIAVNSLPGEGTTFTIYLPASEKPKSFEQSQKGASRGASKEKILVMDDEELVRSLSKAMLKQLGHEVILAEDGFEAIKLYQEAMNSNEPVTVSIMDLTVPGGMGGEKTVQKILELDPKDKVIVASGYSNDPIMANYKAYGFSATIVKPFQLQDLTRAIDSVTS